MSYHPDCADCRERPATVFLPEGRYLCKPCWERLRALRQEVLTATARRSRERSKRLADEARRVYRPRFINNTGRRLR